MIAARLNRPPVPRAATIAAPSLSRIVTPPPQALPQASEAPRPPARPGCRIPRFRQARGNGSWECSRRVRKLAAGRFAVQRRKIDGAWREYEICDRPRVRVGALSADDKGKRKRAKAKIQRLLEQRKKTPKRISASDLKMLKTEKKLIADAIKMAAYQVETELLGMLQDHYSRADEEGRTLLHAAFQSPARLESAEGELRVTIGRQSSPHRTAALATLCEQLDALAVTFPGTQLRLRLAVQAPEPVIS